jgi:para-nitrobenzyl esterase
MSDGVTVFRGVPFATAVRFRPPLVLLLTELPAAGGEFGPPSLQLPDRLDYIFGERLATGSEDCLNLNVYTPDVSGKFPVLVWFHGGAFILGSGRWVWYDATRLAGEQNIVVVTPNYRLGALGYLDVSELGGAEYAASGNSGLLDQIAALAWVKANVHRFGGDPNAVTVGGQSAGGISVSCLLACDRAKGLFQRAIVMSGPPNLVRSKEFAAVITGRFLRACRAKTIDDLNSLTPAQVLSAQLATLKQADFVGEQAFAPTIGDDVLPVPPLHAIRAGTAAGVSLLCGSTADELRMWSFYNPILWGVPFGAVGKWVRSLRLDPRDLRAAYRQDRPDLGLGTFTMAVVGDAIFWMPQLRLAEAQAKHGDTRSYLLRWGGVRKLGALHGVDVPLAFGTVRANGAHHFVGEPDEAETMSAVVRAAWGGVVRTGDPAGGGVPPWPKYDSARTTMILDRTCTVQADPLPAIRAAWDALPFDGTNPSPQQLPRINDVMKYLGTRAVVTVLVVALLIAAVVVWLTWQ